MRPFDLASLPGQCSVRFILPVCVVCAAFISGLGMLCHVHYCWVLGLLGLLWMFSYVLMSVVVPVGVSPDSRARVCAMHVIKPQLQPPAQCENPALHLLPALVSSDW